MGNYVYKMGLTDEKQKKTPAKRNVLQYSAPINHPTLTPPHLATGPPNQTTPTSTGENNQPTPPNRPPYKSIRTAKYQVSGSKNVGGDLDFWFQNVRF